MLEQVEARLRRIAVRRREAFVRDLAVRMEAAAPPRVEVSAGGDGIRLSGRGLSRRFALEPGLRWLLAVLR
jgi:hypothetical protein